MEYRFSTPLSQGADMDGQSGWRIYYAPGAVVEIRESVRYPSGWVQYLLGLRALRPCRVVVVANTYQFDPLAREGDRDNYKTRALEFTGSEWREEVVDFGPVREGREDGERLNAIRRWVGLPEVFWVALARDALQQAIRVWEAAAPTRAAAGRGYEEIPSAVLSLADGSGVTRAAIVAAWVPMVRTAELEAVRAASWACVKMSDNFGWVTQATACD